jgi:cysteine desulfurase / selenocysteine lyase
MRRSSQESAPGTAKFGASDHRRNPTPMLTPETRERDFPTLSGMTYLNTAAEGIPPVVVGEALARYFSHRQMGAPGREHHMREWEALRELVGAMYGLPASSTAVCSCSSEAYNLAATALRLQPGDEVVVNDLDFPSGRSPWLLPGCPAAVKVWRARENALRVDDLVPLLSARTRLVSSSLVSYYNGFMLPLPHVVGAVRRHSPALLALDVTQALGRIPLDLTGADLIVSSTHKWILSTHGGGLVGVAPGREAALTAQAGGWFNLESPFDGDPCAVRAPQPGAASYMVGMPNFPAVYAHRAALDYIRAIGPAEIDRAARPQVAACLAGLTELPVELLTPREPEAIAGIVAFRHPRMAEIHARLAEQQIHVMHSAGRMRLAIHGYNTPADVERFLTALRALL